VVRSRTSHAAATILRRHPGADASSGRSSRAWRRAARKRGRGAGGVDREARGPGSPRGWQPGTARVRGVVRRGDAPEGGQDVTSTVGNGDAARPRTLVPVRTARDGNKGTSAVPGRAKGVLAALRAGR